MELGRTDFCNRQTESWSGKLSGTDREILVRPKRYEGETENLHCELGGTDFGNRQTVSWSGKLGGTDSLISVRPKCSERETESLYCELGETDCSSQLDRNVTKGNREFAIPSW